MTSILAICIWAIATMGLAPLPMRYQLVPGLVSLLVLPVLLVWLARDYGALPVIVVTAAAASLFRKPLTALGRACKRRIVGK